MVTVPMVGSTPQSSKLATASILVDANGDYVEPGAKRVYTLATAGTLSNAVNVAGGRYFWSVESSNWNGGTVKLERQTQDGKSWRTLRTADNSADVALTSDGTVDLLVGQGATLRIAVTGAPANLYANLAGV